MGNLGFWLYIEIWFEKCEFVLEMENLHGKRNIVELLKLFEIHELLGVVDMY